MREQAEADALARDVLRHLAEAVRAGHMVQIHADGSATMLEPVVTMLTTACALVESTDELLLSRMDLALADGEDSGSGEASPRGGTPNT